MRNKVYLMTHELSAGEWDWSATSPTVVLAFAFLAYRLVTEACRSYHECPIFQKGMGFCLSLVLRALGFDRNAGGESPFFVFNDASQVWWGWPESKRQRL